MKKILLVILILLVSGCTIKLNDKIDLTSNLRDDPKKIAKVSTIENPLNSKEIGIADKLSSESAKFFNTNVKVKKFSVALYSDLQEEYKNMDASISPKEGYKFIKLEYETYLKDLDETSLGESSILDVTVLKKDGTKFKGNDIEVDVPISNLGFESALKSEQKGKTICVFLVPNKENSVMLVFGKNNKAYYLLDMEV